MFVVYTVMAVVHMIYTMMKSYWYLLQYIIQQKLVTMFSTHCKVRIFVVNTVMGVVHMVYTTRSYTRVYYGILYNKNL